MVVLIFGGVFGGLFAGVSGGCGGDSSTATGPPSAPTKAEPASPFRYGPTLREAVPSGVTVEPLLEVASPDEARLHIVAAVHRPNATPALRIELWPFTQHNDKGTLAPEGEPELVIPIRRGQPEPPELPKLRVRLAAASSQVARPAGLGVDEANALLPALAKHARVVRDENATADARVAGLVALFRGFDDHVVFETRDLPGAIDALAAGTWNAGEARSISARRSEVTIPTEPPQTIEIAKKSGGWAITDVR